MQSSRQIVTTNKPTPDTFYRPDRAHLSPNQQCQSTEGDLLTSSFVIFACHGKQYIRKDISFDENLRVLLVMEQCVTVAVVCHYSD